MAVTARRWAWSRSAHGGVRGDGRWRRGWWWRPRARKLDFGAQLGDVGGEIVAVGGAFGESARGQRFGPRQLVVEVAGVAARCGERLGVGAQGGSAAGVDVVFGDDVVHAAGGVDEVGAGGVEAGAGGVHGGVDAGGLCGDVVAVVLVAGGVLVVAARRGRR